MTKKTLKLNKESLVVLNEKEMSQINGGGFLSMWGSNCYATNPGRHACCAPDTVTDACNPWSADQYCDMPFHQAYGEVRIDEGGELLYLDNNGAVINNPEFDAEGAPYILVQ